MSGLFRERKKALGILGILALLAQLLFLVNIQFPRGHNFDEFHYVPAAKQAIELRVDRNWEHPPMGKYLIAVGILLDQDRPFGWRLMSTVFGTLTLVGMYFFAFALFRSHPTALFVALITLFNQVLYVQSRIAMLDTFMTGFMIWAMALIAASWNPSLPKRRLRKNLTLAGVLFGLAISSKWFAAVPWISCVGLIVTVRILQHWTTVFAAPSPWKGRSPDFSDWYDPGLFSKVGWPFLIGALGVLPLAVYFLTFVPMTFFEDARMGLLDIIPAQLKMWQGQLRVTTDHPYMSGWGQWALMLRPIWYAFDKEGPGGEWARGVLMIGNPIVMWGGLAALGVCVWAWIGRRSRQAFLIVAFFAMLYLSWAVIPRKVTFYYYYYPAALVLSLALGFVAHIYDRKAITRLPGLSWLRWRWIFTAGVFAVFVYFYPILAALKIRSESLKGWMWLDSWI